MIEERYNGFQCLCFKAVDFLRKALRYGMLDHVGTFSFRDFPMTIGSLPGEGVP